MKILQNNEAMAYHVLPPYGLLNDPNGLVHFKGLTHIFFQWNPHKTDHSYKAWGHAVTTDFVSYTYYEPALQPEEHYEKNGCYSGSALVHEDKLYLFYTGNVKNDEGERESYQCVAVSDDGFTFTKLGAVIGIVPGYTSHVRDPKVFRGDSGEFYMILGAQRTDLTGDTIVYRSLDLLQWEWMGSLCDDKEPFGYMWECPDLVRFKEHDAFILSPQGLAPIDYRFNNIFQTGYWSGKFIHGKFVKNNSSFEELDRGFEFYAPQTFILPDKRVLLIGWMGTMEKAKEEALPTIKDRWAHHLSLPRELSMNVNGKCIQRPVKELMHRFRLKDSVNGSDTVISSEQVFLLEVKSETNIVNMQLRLATDVKVIVERGWFKVERVSWLNGDKEIRQVPLTEALTHLQIFKDNTSIEIFLNLGEEVFSLRSFDTNLNTKIVCQSSNSVTLTLSSFVG